MFNVSFTVPLTTVDEEYVCMLSVDLDSYHLKERLSENEDFILVPAEAWHKLLSWYDLMDDQPPLERKVVLTRLLTFHCTGARQMRCSE